MIVIQLYVIFLSQQPKLLITLQICVRFYVYILCRFILYFSVFLLVFIYIFSVLPGICH